MYVDRPVQNKVEKNQMSTFKLLSFFNQFHNYIFHYQKKNESLHSGKIYSQKSFVLRVEMQLQRGGCLVDCN